MRRRLRKVILWNCLVLLSANGVSLLHFIFNCSTDHLIFCVSVFILLLYVLSIWSWKKVTGKLFDLYTIFVTAAALFNGGYVFSYLFHFDYERNSWIIFPPEIILSALFVVLVGLWSLHFGALFCAIRSELAETVDERRGDIISPHVKNLRYVGWLLFLVSLLPAIVLLKNSLAIVMVSGYFGLFQQEVPTGVAATPRILANFLVPASLFLLAGSEGRPLSVAVSGIAMLFYSLTLLYLGSRAWGSMALIAYLWLWHRCIRPLPTIVLFAVGSILVGLLFPGIRVLRNIQGMERLSLGLIFNVFFSVDNPISSTIFEMGGTMGTIAHTLELVPSVREFDMGAGYLYALFTVLPNFFWTVHPTISRGLMSDWVTWMVDPSVARLGGSLGFSFLAEAYLNFGWFGVTFFVALIGYILARFVLWAEKSGEPSRLAMIASFAAFFPFFARSESAHVVRPLLWYSFLPYLCTQVLQLRAMSGKYFLAKLFSPDHPRSG